MTVMIGIDPHKRSHTAVALDEHDAVLDELRSDADVRPIARLLGWADGWPEQRLCRPRSASCRARGTRPTPTTPAPPRSRAGTPAGCAHGDSVVCRATRQALRELALRIGLLDEQAQRTEAELDVLTEQAAPALRDLGGVGIHTAARLLVAVGDNPERLRSEAAFAHLCGVAPIRASGKTNRHRLNRGGDRSANHALWTIVMSRRTHDERTIAYVARRTAEGLSTRQSTRCLKRYIAREVHRAITRPVRDHRPTALLHRTLPHPRPRHPDPDPRLARRTRHHPDRRLTSIGASQTGFVIARRARRCVSPCHRPMPGRDPCRRRLGGGPRSAPRLRSAARATRRCLRPRRRVPRPRSPLRTSCRLEEPRWLANAAPTSARDARPCTTPVCSTRPRRLLTRAPRVANRTCPISRFGLRREAAPVLAGGR
jgi:hypothetical protein